MDNPKQIECPICKGSGKIKGAKKTAETRKRRRADIAKRLKEEGYSIREIMALMGYKSPQSITLLLAS